MVAAARAAHGPIDIVIANAGAADSAPAAKHRPCAVAAHDRRQSHRRVPHGEGGPSRCHAQVRTAARRIVFIASTAGLKGYPYVAAYCAAKHGVVGLMRALGLELARNRRHRQRRMSRLHRHAVARVFSRRTLPPRPAARRKRPRAMLARTIPHGRLITPDEVAQAVLWLCCTAAASVNRPGN